MTDHLYDEGKGQQIRQEERDKHNNKVKMGSSSSSQNKNSK